ncbi:1,4-alpha-glucan-branching enzyme 1, chloroplastic/amyloplastic [Dorcoceras hygrometricum]|uniref:1,4-alpha-glucan-branching enzyme 1, chloroplastic/amyloplastic n=1 Tax=Dorcoceras hygrometricum TaxID=472368 RepID=A0A2Z7AXZ3_9LAMI|nr:1,4-alpha-glucan-branching enzyme 1, chloroplastic/amyloplastic [Dorcoceras hygrometricum]
MKRRRAEESADGLALMTSLVTSSQSADGLSQAVARISSSRKIPAGSICLIPAGQPDSSNSSIQSLGNPVASYSIQSQEIQAQRIVEVEKRIS